MNNISENPLVSVIVPVYNGEEYLGEAIESIISQTYDPLEIIVVDDGSTDSSREIILSFPQIKYIYQENKGHAAARNQGIKASKGDFIAFLDADDFWVPEKISMQISEFIADPKLDIVTGHVRQFLDPQRGSVGKEKLNTDLPPLPGYSPIAILIKRDFLGVVGLFHEDVLVGEAISWFTKVLEFKPKIRMLPEVVAIRRIHGGNLSIQHQQEKNKAIIKILKTSLSRRRSGDFR